MTRLLRNFREFGTALLWVVGSLLFSAFSLAVVLGMAWLVRLAFPFLPNYSIIFVLPLCLVIYLVLAGWIAWKIVRRRLSL